MLYIVSDHAGFELKKTLVDHLKSKGLEVEDCGPFAFDKSDDYPDFVFPCAKKVAENLPDAKGIIAAHTGNGEAMLANKVRGIRAAVYYGGPKDIVKLSREHNHANMLSLGAHFLSPEEAKEAVDLWLATETKGGRHERRVKKVEELEK